MNFRNVHESVQGNFIQHPVDKREKLSGILKVLLENININNILTTIGSIVYMFEILLKLSVSYIIWYYFFHPIIIIIFLLLHISEIIENLQQFIYNQKEKTT